MTPGTSHSNKVVDNVDARQPNARWTARPRRAHKPRFSVFRFLLGSSAALALAATVWPMLPRHYVSEATLVIQPSGVSNTENLQVSSALRQPLDESAILSEIDTLRSDFLLDRLMQDHALLRDPEFSGPGRLSRLRVQIASLIAPDEHIDIGLPDPGRGRPAKAVRLEQKLLGVSSAHAAPSGPIAGESGMADVAVDRRAHALPGPADAMETHLEGLRTRIAMLIEPPEPQPLAYDEIRNRLRDAIEISRDRRSYTLQVSVRSEDPEKASILNRSFINAYLDRQVDRKRNAVDHLAAYLRERTETLRARAQDSRARMVEFMERSGLVDEGARTSLDAKLTSLSTESAIARARAIEASARASSLTHLKEADALDSAPAVLESPTVQRLKQSLAEALFRTAVSPVEIESIQERIADEQERIVAGAMIEAENWSSRQALLDREIAAIRRLMVERRKSELVLEDLARQSDSDEAAYRHASSELRTLAPGEQTYLPDAELISLASVPTKAAFPNPLLFGLGALVFSLVAGVGLNFRALLADLVKLARG